MRLQFLNYHRGIEETTSCQFVPVYLQKAIKRGFDLQIVLSNISVIVNSRAKIILSYAFLYLLLIPTMGSANTGIDVSLRSNNEQSEININSENIKFIQAERSNFHDKNCFLCRLSSSLNYQKYARRFLEDNNSNQYQTSGKFQPRIIPKKILNSQINNHQLKNKVSEPNFFKTLVRKRRNTGDKRVRRLNCRTGFFLQILPNGRVDGTYDKNSPLGIMLMHSVGVGLISIQSRATGRFLALNRSGRLYSTTRYDPKRNNFEERMQPSWFTTYASTSPRHPYVGLSKRGKPKKGTKITENDISSHFLALEV